MKKFDNEEVRKKGLACKMVFDILCYSIQNYYNLRVIFKWGFYPSVFAVATLNDMERRLYNPFPSCRYWTEKNIYNKIRQKIF